MGIKPILLFVSGGFILGFVIGFVWGRIAPERLNLFDVTTAPKKPESEDANEDKKRGQARQARRPGPTPGTMA